jgi:hypothetical protein
MCSKWNHLVKRLSFWIIIAMAHLNMFIMKPLCKDGLIFYHCKGICPSKLIMNTLESRLSKHGSPKWQSLYCHAVTDTLNWLHRILVQWPFVHFPKYAYSLTVAPTKRHVPTLYHYKDLLAGSKCFASSPMPSIHQIKSKRWCCWRRSSCTLPQ